MSTPDDLNAAFTADQWLEQDLRAICGLLGLDEEYADFATHVWSGSGLDVVLACAEWELERL